MLSRVRDRFQSLAMVARDRWSRLGRRRQVVLAVAGALVVAAGISGAVVLGLGGGQSTCDRPLCVEVLGPEGDAVPPMTPVRIRLVGDLDREAAVEGLEISQQPAGLKRFEGTCWCSARSGPASPGA